MESILIGIIVFVGIFAIAIALAYKDKIQDFLKPVLHFLFQRFLGLLLALGGGALVGEGLHSEAGVAGKGIFLGAGAFLLLMGIRMIFTRTDDFGE